MIAEKINAIGVKTSHTADQVTNKKRRSESTYAAVMTKRIVATRKAKILLLSIYC